MSAPPHHRATTTPDTGGCPLLGIDVRRRSQPPGAPLITSVADTYDVALAAAQWTLTITLLTGAVTTPCSTPRLRSAPTSHDVASSP